MIKTERKSFVKVYIHKIENEIENIFQNSMCALKQYFLWYPMNIYVASRIFVCAFWLGVHDVLLSSKTTTVIILSLNPVFFIN